VRRSEVFFTVADNQTSVDVRIYQGEAADAAENVMIGQFRVDGLSRAPSGNPVIIDLALDRDGILQVSAREKVTGLERRITIDKATSRFDQAQLVEARARIGAMFEGGEVIEPAPANGSAIAALLDKASSKLDAAGAEDRAELIDLIETIRDASSSGDDAALETGRQQLQDLLFFLET
jgi:molecular chaperone DnaK (HSP70)